MNAAHVVLLIAVFLTIVAIAAFLIAVTLILRHVVNRLVTILGAVEAVTQTSQPLGPVIDDINRDLDAGRRLMEDAVGIEDSRAGAASEYAPADTGADTERGLYSHERSWQHGPGSWEHGRGSWNR